MKVEIEFCGYKITASSDYEPHGIGNDADAMRAAMFARLLRSAYGRKGIHFKDQHRRKEMSISQKHMFAWAGGMVISSAVMLISTLGFKCDIAFFVGLVAWFASFVMWFINSIKFLKEEN